MSKSAPPAATPKGLGTRGRAFWRATTSGFELSGPEVELLAEVCRTLDEIDGLRASVARDGTTVPGSTGQPRVHPALAQLGQHRLALGRLLAQLGLPDEAGDAVPSPVQARARRAAAARWGGRGASA